MPRLEIAAAFLLLLSALLGCSAAVSATDQASPSPSPPLGNVILTPVPPVTATFEAGGGLPLAPGIAWIYSYKTYEQAANSPSEIITATYVITETILKVEDSAPYRIGQVRHSRGEVSIPPGWNDMESNPEYDFWYVVEGNRIYQSPQRPGTGGTDQLSMTLAFDLPLAMGKYWCPRTPPAANPECMSMGKRKVEATGTYASPAGRFQDCAEISEDYNSGGITRWFCPGVGVVAAKYDHIGTRFGFTQVLLQFDQPGPP